ncbi:MAG: NAD-dependent epimerase/dehydratase family protein [Anaerolineales bacterium]
MKILVTGGAGFIGSHVVDAMLAVGHSVVIVDDLSTGRKRNLNPAAKFYQMDIRDPGLAGVIERERPEVIDHHAAQMDVRRSVVDPLFDADVNVRGTINLLEAARTHGVRKVIYVSTGGAAYGEPKYLPCDEDHPIDPICQYGVSKHVVEHYLFVYKHLYGLDYTVLRYPNVYGPRQDPHGEAGVIAILSGQMLAGKPVTINGTGQQERDFVYVADCARANVLALNNGSGTIYNLGSNRGTSVNLLFSTLANIIGYSAEPRYGPAKAGETFKIYLDGTRARDQLDWSPTVDLDRGLQQTVAYLREHERD